MGVWTAQQLVFGFFLDLGGYWERGADYAGDILLLTDNSFFFFHCYADPFCSGNRPWDYLDVIGFHCINLFLCAHHE
jgi:hypothetical protein